MTHQSGIHALVILGKSCIRHSWDQDYDAAVTPMLDESIPCYVFVNDWLLINWVPERATVRDKMLYASTRATLRKQFGEHLIKEDISDVTLNGFKKYLTMKSAPAPLTAAEQEKADVLKHEVDFYIQFFYVILDRGRFFQRPSNSWICNV
ncbi:unnamed protein product [Echinostoma caproni]|uniref:ADF-H domain-containing protein n=1 Tax=Echinostoma caproni TaxID=27848 RepID=A0A183BE80_9TREM|nr:unnamed protein product [Echinostoma caproni]